MAEIVGGVFVTVTKKVSLALFTPSLTVTVMVAVPVWPDAGVTVTVRFASAPPKTIFAVGTSVVLSEALVRVRLLEGVPASVIEKGILLLVESTAMSWLGMSLIVGPV